uniref:Lipoprotein n=1 Tax=Streptomyces sp. NBC_00093 TaxID=2975649 RepID=A0AAU2AEL0_9ACTN
MKPRIGMMLASTVDNTTVVVVRWAAGEQEVTCGGSPMVDQTQHDASPAETLDPDQASGTLLGKRYVTADGSVELLCTKPGKGSLAVGGVPLAVKSPKPMPASD